MTQPSFRSARSTIATSTLVELLAPSLGEDAAQEVVERACEAPGLTSMELTRDEALRVLEVVAEQPGLVGITARFAKSRVLLQAK